MMRLVETQTLYITQLSTILFFQLAESCSLFNHLSSALATYELVTLAKGFGEGIAFGSVCYLEKKRIFLTSMLLASVCLCVCLCVCLSVRSPPTQTAQQIVLKFSEINDTDPATVPH